jgi:hypothetical protein
MLNRQLHGELLSVHKINQAFPGTPRVSKRFLDTLANF